VQLILRGDARACVIRATAPFEMIVECTALWYAVRFWRLASEENGDAAAGARDHRVSRCDCREMSGSHRGTQEGRAHVDRESCGRPHRAAPED
jgi:hypothetical protein